MQPERAPQPIESNERSKAELEALGNEKLRELAEQSAERPDDNPDKRLEQARENLKAQEVAPEPPASGEQAKPATFVSKLDRFVNYSQTLASVQRRLSPASRSFSKVIHAPAVEKASEALEKTIMRPSVTLGATWTALVLGFLVYFTSRHYGWQMSGFELIGSLIIGGFLGFVIEKLYHTVRRPSA
jgi:hypothetical protein